MSAKTETAIEEKVVDAPDPERARRDAAAEAQRLLRLRDAFCEQHPRVPREQIKVVKEADFYTVSLDGSVWKMTLLSAERCALARVDPADHAVLLEPPVPIRLPQPPAPPVPPDVVHVAYSLKAKCADALQRLRQDVASWSDLVSPGRPPLDRLRVQVPGLIALPNGQHYNDSGLSALAHDIMLVAQLRRTVPEAQAADRALVIEATAAIRSALVSISQPTQTSIRTAGEIAAAMRTQVEVNLDSVQDQVDTLERALVELAPTIQTLIETTPDYLTAALRVLLEGRAACCTLYIERTQALLRQLREYRPADEAHAAVEAMARALGLTLTLPTFTWGDDLLAVPTIR